MNYKMWKAGPTCMNRCCCVGCGNAVGHVIRFESCSPTLKKSISATVETAAAAQPLYAVRQPAAGTSSHRSLTPGDGQVRHLLPALPALLRRWGRMAAEFDVPPRAVRAGRGRELSHTTIPQHRQSRPVRNPPACPLAHAYCFQCVTITLN
jgi:hypothetical protein